MPGMVWLALPRHKTRKNVKRKNLTLDLAFGFGKFLPAKVVFKF
jgi:hypothetical protein